MTDSMQQAIDETNRRRAIQAAYNKEHGITPKTIFKSRESILGQTVAVDSKKTSQQKYYAGIEETSVAADPVVKYMDKAGLDKMVTATKKKMEKAAKDLDFIEAARLRDEWQELQKLRDEK
jgi:excinuclease ABC subunit B